MNKKQHADFVEAKKTKNLSLMNKVYGQNQKDRKVKFEYAILLRKYEKYDEARKLFESLLDRSNWTYSMLELGILERQCGNYDKSRECLKSLLHAQNRNLALLELGILERRCGNYKKSREYFESLLNTKSRSYAIRELGKLELNEGNMQKAEELFKNEIKKLGGTIFVEALIRLYINSENYLEAFKYIYLAKEKKIKIGLEPIIYVAKALNISFKELEYIVLKYNTAQLIDYDEHIAIEHIVERHKKDFSENIDIYRVFNNIKEKLEPTYKKVFLEMNDIYIIPYKGIGPKYNLLKVVTLPNTKNILTMYPIGIEEIDYEDKFIDNDNTLKLKK